MEQGAVAPLDRVIVEAPTVSRRMQAVQQPIIPVVGELIRAHHGTISLAQGVVFYGPPPEAAESVRDFVVHEDGHKYGAVQGTTELRERIVRKLREENGVDVGNGHHRLVVTAGGNMAFLNALFAICDPGDEVILPLPYYFNHEMAIRMLNCTPVCVPTDDDFQLRPNLLREAITRRTRAIVTVSPNNPSGAVYPRAALVEVNELCRASGIYHISDEAYEYFTYGGVDHFSPGVLPDAHGHTISLYSLSKSYGFAGWRVGYMVIPEHLYMAVLKAQDTNLICANLLAQHAAAACLRTGTRFRAEKIAALATVREAVLRELSRLAPRCVIPRPDGAFYVLLKVDTDIDPMAIVERLIREHRVAALPGTAFGLDRGCHLRISYGALDPATALAGIERLVCGLEAILASRSP